MIALIALFLLMSATMERAFKCQSCHAVLAPHISSPKSQRPGEEYVVCNGSKDSPHATWFRWTYTIAYLETTVPANSLPPSMGRTPPVQQQSATPPAQQHSATSTSTLAVLGSSNDSGKACTIDNCSHRPNLLCRNRKCARHCRAGAEPCGLKGHAPKDMTPTPAPAVQPALAPSATLPGPAHTQDHAPPQPMGGARAPTTSAQAMAAKEPRFFSQIVPGYASKHNDEQEKRKKRQQEEAERIANKTKTENTVMITAWVKPGIPPIVAAHQQDCVLTSLTLTNDILDSVGLGDAERYCIYKFERRVFMSVSANPPFVTPLPLTKTKEIFLKSLDLRVEDCYQLNIHLHSLPGSSAQAPDIRSNLPQERKAVLAKRDSRLLSRGTPSPSSPTAFSPPMLLAKRLYSDLSPSTSYTSGPSSTLAPASVAEPTVRPSTPDAESFVDLTNLEDDNYPTPRPLKRLASTSKHVDRSTPTPRMPKKEKVWPSDFKVCEVVELLDTLYAGGLSEDERAKAFWDATRLPFKRTTAREAYVRWFTATDEQREYWRGRTVPWQEFQDKFKLPSQKRKSFLQREARRYKQAERRARSSWG
ncbi:hypothetical protein CC1G_02395 [Coprinopsis cinerea okayama7|uniref:Uncharacterized protein n=1 Tax=Coprinopsis cinerea (strain Okayama-7 / 130 / ATCC MYA-4618 / FGSC 9003) TaxID=240176 RepID=A8N7Y8_COPC7|nr:hypothetical protein CC1G_02395 [Coprinopsis cinerea okayama7\|eukprot:XP_001830944.2 hypothetical protein CC1G_02395 [Coprinopsis cinerea okayama7\